MMIQPKGQLLNNIVYLFYIDLHIKLEPSTVTLKSCVIEIQKLLFLSRQNALTRLRETFSLQNYCDVWYIFFLFGFNVIYCGTDTRQSRRLRHVE